MTVPRDADESVTRVLVVSKTHLDVGFTATAAQVRERYLCEYFPRAMAVADELRSRGGPERLRWTTGSWILTEALDAAVGVERQRLESAIERGDLCWHALPFTLHTEYGDRSLLEHGLTLSAELDRRFGRRTRSAKVTDVPGHTRALVSLLADAGVDFLHIGVNPASACPEVPLRFRWIDEAAPRLGSSGAPVINVMYQPGGYGDVQVIGDVALVVDLTGDNLGPRSAADVVECWAALADRFPGASISAGTFDDVAAVVASVADELPEVRGEIGDTWIQGVGTDPQKTAGFRALSRLRRSWIASGAVAADDPLLSRASTELLCVAEHTWGLDQKTHWPDTTNWSAEALAGLRNDPATQRFRASWGEQRALLDRFVELLAESGRTDLADAARAELARTRRVARLAPARPMPAPAAPGRARASAPTHDESGAELGLDGGAIEFGSDGAVTRLRSGDVELASERSPLGGLRFRTYDDADFERWYSTYNASTTPDDEWWARWDNTKPGLAGSGAISRWWYPTLRDVSVVGGAAVARLGFDVPEDVPVALPADLELTVRLDAEVVEFDLRWFGRPAARWPGSVWWTFAPAVEDPDGWEMSKLGEWVSPFEVVAGGGVHLHCAERVRHVGADIGIEFVDTALVAPGEPRLLEWPPTEVDLSVGWNLCLHDNVWGTNFPMWDEGDARFRVRLDRARNQRQSGDGGVE